MLAELAVNSDRLFISAVVVYVLAMALSTMAQASISSRQALLVDTTGNEVDGYDVAPSGSSAAAGIRGDRYARMSTSLVVLGAILHLASIVARGIAASRWPLGNMYEFIAAITLAATVTWLVMLRRLPQIRTTAAFVLLPVVVLMTIGGTALYTQVAPVMPALQSYWLPIHVTGIMISSGLLLVSGVASALFLLRSSGRFEMLSDRLPTADILDRFAYRIMIVTFPLFTFAVVAGAVWAESAWGRFWGWDPKETVTFVSWVIYAAYLHARATAGWRAGRAAWINVAGFISMLFNLFFVNLVVAGLHSYAGVP